VRGRDADRLPIVFRSAVTARAIEKRSLIDRKVIAERSETGENDRQRPFVTCRAHFCDRVAHRPLGRSKSAFLDGKPAREALTAGGETVNLGQKSITAHEKCVF
jgi:hypothetical protein